MAGIKWIYGEGFAGVKAVAKNNNAEAVSEYELGRGTAWSCEKGDYAYLTGYYYIGADTQYIYIQTTYGICITYNLDNPDWEFVGDVNSAGSREARTVRSQTDAQRLVNKICQNDLQITQNNLVCARYANCFTAAQKSKIRDLQRRVETRKEALQKDGLCENVQTALPEGYANLQGYLDKLMAGESVGLATWAVVVIVATVIAATATAAYFAYKRLADESEQDIKYSKELTAILAQKLTPEEYEQLLQETKGIVTKAKIKQAIGSYGRVLWIVGVAVAGAFAYKFLRNRFAQ